jgi:hypothetical protein
MPFLLERIHRGVKTRSAGAQGRVWEKTAK